MKELARESASLYSFIKPACLKAWQKGKKNSQQYCYCVDRINELPQKQVDVLSLIFLAMPDKLSHPFLEVHNSSLGYF